MSILSSSVGRRVVTGTTLALTAALVLWWNERASPGLVPWGAGLFLLLVALAELARMRTLVERPTRRALWVAGLGMAAASLWGVLFAHGAMVSHPAWVLVLGSYAGVLLVALLASGAGPRLVLTLGMAAWVVPPLFGWIVVDARWGLAGLVSLVVLSKIGDIFGYFVGRAIGRSHPFPRISPGKTTAGCVASVVAAMLAGIALAASGMLPGGTWLSGALLGVLTNLAAQGGDLLESAVKRRAGVKTRGSILGPAGGVLDLVDSFLLAIPTALVVWPWLLD